MRQTGGTLWYNSDEYRSNVVVFQQSTMREVATFTRYYQAVQQNSVLGEKSMTELDVKTLRDRFRSHLPDRSSRKLEAVFSMLKTFGGVPPEASFLNIDHFKCALVAFFKLPFKPQEAHEFFQELNRNGDGQLHVRDFIAGLQVREIATYCLTHPKRMY